MRGHALGPFSIQSNLRVQNVIILLPNQTKSVFCQASAANPTLIRFNVNTDVALPTGTNALVIGNTGSANAYFASGDTNPGATGLATEKRFVLTADTTIICALTSAAIAASKALTVSAITGANTQTVTIGGQVYTFNTSLTNTANNVLIGADATAMAANLAAAINAGAGAGTLYGTGTVANTSVSGAASLGVMTATARTPGAAGNSIAISETLTNSAWAGGATALSGGADASAATGQMTVFIDA